MHILNTLYRTGYTHLYVYGKALGRNGLGFPGISNQIGQDWSSSLVYHHLFSALHLNCNSKVTRTKTKIIKGKRGEN